MQKRISKKNFNINGNLCLFSKLTGDYDLKKFKASSELQQLLENLNLDFQKIKIYVKEDFKII